MTDPIWIWQQIASPHMAGLARALAERGRDVVYVAGQGMSREREALGWSVPDFGHAQLRIAASSSEALQLVAEAPGAAIHICQGLRGNGYVRDVMTLLARSERRMWVTMEVVEDSGIRGGLKRRLYKHLLAGLRPAIDGVLAIGHHAKSWIEARGVDETLIFPFAYFLPDGTSRFQPDNLSDRPFRVLFVGQLVRRKRLDLLIGSLVDSLGCNVELAVVGSGPLEGELRAAAERQLGSRRVHWVGTLPMSRVSEEVVRADCLVLPSDFDGWGAVVSEALMMGTPAICSDQCGSLGAVRASGVGGVFRAKSRGDLSRLIQRQVKLGKQGPDSRAALAAWARCLGARSGAAYLERILDSTYSGGEVPHVPWSI